ncbi:endonuclease/exonuclease/phosphatase family protein [Kitasatospora sp. NPDC050543]|uniref:endonuclease/exonuclease/phosphatase family protein n=1 Tax=Kitasatospora sp. NPDC050543 TaxID=3364054 RepID=UPI0037AD8FE6
MRVATFNVLHGLPMDRGRPVPAGAGADPAAPLAEAIGSLDADVLALQELDRFQERSGGVDQAALAAVAANACDWRYASALHGRSVPGKGWVLDRSAPGLRVSGPADSGTAHGDPPHGDPTRDVPSHGIALFTRLPVRAWRARGLAAAPLALPLRVPRRPGLTLVRDQPRAAIAAVLEGERGPFTVLAVHLSFVPGWNVRQLLALRSWIADLPRPHVLLGDFNLVAGLPRAVLDGGAMLSAVTSGPREARAARRRWHDLARAATYPAHRPLVQFDHILASGLRPTQGPAPRTPQLPVSDHRPLLAEVDW